MFGGKWFSFNKLRLYHQMTPAFSAVALPMETLCTHQQTEARHSFALNSQDTGALRVAGKVPNLDISEFWMLWPQQYVCPHQIHSFFLLLLPLDNFKDEKQTKVDKAKSANYIFSFSTMLC